MNKITLILHGLICIILLGGCGDDLPEQTLGKYESGVFIVNQGKFGDGTGTITYFDRDTTLIQNVFQTENGGSVLGNIAQSMYSINNKTYIAINNASKIEVVNTNDFTKVTSIEGLAQVRYMISSDIGNSLYASSWGADGTSGVLYEINTATDRIVSQLQTGGGLENMVADGSEIYVTKSGGFGTDSLVLRYDISRSVIEKEYVVGDNPVGIIKDNEDEIWVLCTGAFDFTNPDNNTAGGLYRLTDDQAELKLELANGANNLVVDKASNKVYHLDGEGIKVIDLSTMQSSLFASGFYYALGFDPKDQKVYAADAKDFASNGEVIIFNRNRSEEQRLKAGIIPGSFFFTD